MTFPHLSQAQVVMDAPTQVETRPFTKVLSLAAPYFSILVLLPPSPHSHTLNVPSSKTLLKPSASHVGVRFPPCSIRRPPTYPSRSSSNVTCCRKPSLRLLDKSKPLLSTYNMPVPELGSGR